nr:hypothetical protein Iba_chr15bCG8020 [Ipomoea batatas]
MAIKGKPVADLLSSLKRLLLPIKDSTVTFENGQPIGWSSSVIQAYDLRSIRCKIEYLDLARASKRSEEVGRCEIGPVPLLSMQTTISTILTSGQSLATLRFTRLSCHNKFVSFVKELRKREHQKGLHSSSEALKSVILETWLVQLIRTKRTLAKTAVKVQCGPSTVAHEIRAIEGPLANKRRGNRDELQRNQACVLQPAPRSRYKHLSGTDVNFSTNPTKCYLIHALNREPTRKRNLRRGIDHLLRRACTKVDSNTQLSRHALRQ